VSVSGVNTIMLPSKNIIEYHPRKLNEPLFSWLVVVLRLTRLPIFSYVDLS